ncbi:MAG TPA: energy transducer TonB [Thermoanaerobaculia bacterium]|jgi:protein TonB|nr:energy transducer TonB [Thermoanaerobaculia bacterium]
MMRGGWRPYPPLTSAEPTPSAEPAAAAVAEEPEPTPTAAPTAVSSEEIEREVEREFRRMKARLDRAAAAPEASQDIHRVGGEVAAPRLVRQVQPVYPLAARLTGTQGVVIVEAVIDQHGEVSKVRVLKGLPHGLDDAAVEAVEQWKFAPAMLYGKPVAVYFTLTVNFRIDSRAGSG